MDGTAELLESDRRFLVHPLHHPEEHKAPLLVTEGRGEMRKIAYASAYVGATNEPAIRLGEKIVGHAYANSSAIYYTTGGAESNESALKTARVFWKIQDKPD